MSKRQYPINPKEWLIHLEQSRGKEEIDLIHAALGLYDSASISQLEKGLGIADILFDLGLDTATLAAAIAYPAVQAHDVHVDSITDRLGEASRKLIQDVLQMQA